MNEGKRFEKCIVDSIDQSHVLVKRLNDNASSWAGGNNTRFSSKNECDFILFDENTDTFYGLELKSTKGTSLTFWREDFDQKATYMIKKNQIQGLQKWNKYKGVFGFLINFRDADNHTYFVDIKEFIDYTSALSKKSVNRSDVLAMHPIELHCTKLRTNYRYDVERFFKEARIL